MLAALGRLLYEPYMQKLSFTTLSLHAFIAPAPALPGAGIGADFVRPYAHHVAGHAK